VASAPAASDPAEVDVASAPLIVLGVTSS